ncbi:MAG: LysM peptidoglycan-binding domain-containing protein [Verrucomicrobiae bacterium]|nr:LysM peptidoglycan-binding domain-containing protein [Verrucomicrobiae bacterium]
MSSQNPLMPQGALDEQRPRSKSNVYIAVFAILAFHVVLLGALLLQGCKDNRGGASVANNNEAGLVLPSNPPPADLGMANPFAPPPDVASNPVGTTAPPAPVNTLAGGGATLPPTPGPAVVTPPTATPAPAATAAGVREHEVQAGENFTTIGKKYNVSPTAIAKANPGVDSRRLRVGQKLKIPEAAATVAAAPETRAPAATPAAAPVPAGAVTYEVKPGDTLTKIARSQGTSVEKIKSANNLKTTMIRAGQKLVIPPRQEAAPAAPAVPPTSTGYVTPLPGRTTASL